MPKPKNLRLLDALKMGLWVRTVQPPYVAVKWVPELKEDGTRKLQGQRWEEILPANSRRRKPKLFRAEDVTSVPPTEPMAYPPRKGSGLCGWRLQPQDPERYCARRATTGNLCALHEAEWSKEEES